MAGRYQFTNPGSAVQASLEDLMVRRAAEQRQVMLDQIMQQREVRAAEAQQQEQALRTQQMGLQVNQGQLQRDQFDYGKAQDIVESAGANEVITPDTAALLDRAGFGGRKTSITDIKTPGLGVLAEEELPPDAAMPTEETVLKPGPKYEAARASEDAKMQLEREKVATATQAAKEKLEAQEAARVATEEGKNERHAADIAARKETAELMAGTKRDLAAEKKADEAKLLEGRKRTAQSMVLDTTALIDKMMPNGALSQEMADRMDPIKRGFRFMPGTKAADGEAMLKQLGGQLIIDMLTEMKAQTKTGASGFGALSEGELKVLSAAAGRLSTMQSPKLFKEALNDIKVKLNRAFEDGTAPLAPPAGADPALAAPVTRRTPEQLFQQYRTPRQ